MNSNPELDRAYRETAMGLSENLNKPLIAHNDAADGFENDPFAQDPGERLRGDPEAEADDVSLEAALDRAMDAFQYSDRDLSEPEKLVRAHLASIGPTLGDRLEQIAKQLARLEANIAFVVSYVNTLALPVRDPLDLPEPPAGSAEYIELMKAATDEVLGRRPDVEPIPPSPIHVDPRDPGLASQSAYPNDPIDCVHPNDCQFPRCLCGTEFSGMAAHIGKQAESRHTTGSEITGRTTNAPGEAPDCAGAKGGCPDVDGEHCPRAHDGLSAEDVCVLRDQAALTAVLEFMDRFLGRPDNTVTMTLTPTEFRAVRHAIARELGSTPMPDPHPLSYRIPNDMAHVLDSVRIALHDLTHSRLPGADVYFTKAELRSIMAVVRGFKPADLPPSMQEPEPQVGDNKAYWLGGDGKFYVLDPKGVMPFRGASMFEAAYGPHMAYGPLTRASSPTNAQGQPTASIGSLLDALHSALEHSDAAEPVFQMPREAIHNMISLAHSAAKALDNPPLKPLHTPDHVLVARKTLNRALEALTLNPHQAEFTFTRYQVHLIDSALNAPPLLLDQGRTAFASIWDRILNEDRQTIIALAGDLRQHTQSPAFARAWGAITSLVDARAMLSPASTQCETLVLRLDAVRAVHKVLLAVRSLLLQNCNT